MKGLEFIKKQIPYIDPSINSYYEIEIDDDYYNGFTTALKELQALKLIIVKRIDVWAFIGEKPTFERYREDSELQAFLSAHELSEEDIKLLTEVIINESDTI